MANDLTTGELFSAKIVLEDDIAKAVQTLLDGDRSGAYRFADGYTLDLAAALKGREVAAKALEVPTASLAYKRNMARTAILLARPAKG